MLDYLVDKLAGYVPTPHKKEIISGIESDYLTLDKGSMVFLINKPYPNNLLNKIHSQMKQSNPNLGYVFLKDGKTFFRSAAEANYFKKSNQLSLKNYSNDDMNKMILFRPEESFLNNLRTTLQYYQPDSQRLSAALVNFKFNPVHFDYSHIDNTRFKPNNKDSEKLNLWYDREEIYNRLKLENKYLKTNN